MKFFAVFGGPIFILLLMLNQFRYYGTRWEIGSLGVPRSLVSPDGQTYADGTPVDAISGMINRSGMEEPFLLAMFLLSVAMMIAAVRFTLSNARLRRRISELRRMEVE